MAAKQSKKGSGRSSSRLPVQGAGRRFGPGFTGLIIGVIALAVLVVAGLIILGPGTGRASALQPESVSLDKSTGVADAPVVVVEFADFQCPYCGQFATGAERQLRQDYVDKGQVRYAFREMAFIGAESLWAAEAAECANEQGRFWDYHDKLFASQAGENQGAFSRDRLKGFAAELGLNTAQFNECLDSDKYQAKIEQDTAAAAQLGVHSTPTIFVNGQLIPNGSDYQTLKTAIAAQLQK